ncbi:MULTISPECIES: hypothetical protein [Kamptonema]|uniref:hypothetical protein n=1 Tax=Kamptonema TaxID=1501433 RepID=UPI0001DAC309|nr:MULTISPECIES: hypothetical protein [Kamptonema]CBN57904.1 hypothetical protein OSCI_3540025 [Kamptonema sp. PCC 6506]
MKSSSAAQIFWSILSSFIFVCLIPILAIFYWFGLKVGLVITFLFSLCFLWLLSYIKSKLLMGMPDEFKYQSAIVTDNPLLNITWLQQQTSALESLGFVQLIDYKTGENPGLGRCFAHPQHYCYAEVTQSFQKTGELLIRQIAISSNLDEGWQLGTVNRQANVIDSIPYGFWRNPKSVRICYPDLSLEEVFEKHLEFRQRMVADLGITVLTDVSWENYVKIEQEATTYRKRSLKRKNLLLAMIEVTLFELNPKSEWLGDYAKFARQR